MDHNRMKHSCDHYKSAGGYETHGLQEVSPAAAVATCKYELRSRKSLHLAQYVRLSANTHTFCYRQLAARRWIHLKLKKDLMTFYGNVPYSLNGIFHYYS